MRRTGYSGSGGLKASCNCRARRPRYSSSRGVTFPIVRDGSGSTIGKYGVTGFPETYVLDREGRVVEAIVGAVNSAEDKARLRTAIERARSS